MFQRTVTAICLTIGELPIHPRAIVLDPAGENVSGFVLASLDAMPHWLGFGLKTLTLVFAFAGLLLRGRFFDSGTRQDRAAQWQRWRGHRLSPLRDFVRFYESLAILALYARSETIPSLP